MINNDKISHFSLTNHAGKFAINTNLRFLDEFFAACQLKKLCP